MADGGGGRSIRLLIVACPGEGGIADVGQSADNHFAGWPRQERG